MIAAIVCLPCLLGWCWVVCAFLFTTLQTEFHSALVDTCSPTCYTRRKAEQLLQTRSQQALDTVQLLLQVAKVELHLNYEGDVSVTLAVGSIDNFILKLAVHPATLQLDASLGNLVAEYGSLAPGHPNRVMVSMRDKQAGSLIEVTFRWEVYVVFYPATVWVFFCTT